MLEKDLAKFDILFLDKKNSINTYYNKYKSYELEHFINNNIIKIIYSKYGLIELKSSTLDQSLEIVRRSLFCSFCFITGLESTSSSK